MGTITMNLNSWKFGFAPLQVVDVWACNVASVIGIMCTGKTPARKMRSATLALASLHCARAPGQHKPHRGSDGHAVLGHLRSLCSGLLPPSCSTEIPPNTKGEREKTEAEPPETEKMNLGHCDVDPLTLGQATGKGGGQRRKNSDMSPSPGTGVTSHEPLTPQDASPRLRPLLVDHGTVETYRSTKP